jgi:hypothetical protein
LLRALMDVVRYAPTNRHAPGRIVFESGYTLHYVPMPAYRQLTQHSLVIADERFTIEYYREEVNWQGRKVS